MKNQTKKAITAIFMLLILASIATATTNFYQEKNQLKDQINQFQGNNEQLKNALQESCENGQSPEFITIYNQELAGLGNVKYCRVTGQLNTGPTIFNKITWYVYFSPSSGNKYVFSTSNPFKYQLEYPNLIQPIPETNQLTLTPQQLTSLDAENGFDEWTCSSNGCWTNEITLLPSDIDNLINGLSSNTGVEVNMYFGSVWECSVNGCTLQ